MVLPQDPSTDLEHEPSSSTMSAQPQVLKARQDPGSFLQEGVAPQRRTGFVIEETVGAGRDVRRPGPRATHAGNRRFRTMRFGVQYYCLV